MGKRLEIEQKFYFKDIQSFGSLTLVKFKNTP